MFDCRLRISRNSQWRLKDCSGDATYDRDGNDLQARGLYLDVPPWKAHIFSLTQKQTQHEI